MADRSTAFLFDVLDWRSSRTVQRMSFALRGMFLEMLCEQWDKKDLPDDPVAVAELLGGTVEEWAAAWPVLRRQFVDRRSHPRGGDVAIPTTSDRTRRIVNLRLERTRRERLAYLKRQADAGRKGGLSKAQRIERLSSSKPTGSLEGRQRVATGSLSTSKEGNGKVLSGREGKGDKPAPPQVTYEGSRLKVFRWMHEDLVRRLGARDFDLLGWYLRLNVELERTGEGYADAWKFLQERLYRDAELPLPNLYGRTKTAGNVAAAERFVARGQS